MWAWPVLGVLVTGGALCNLLLLLTGSAPPVLRALAAADLSSLLLLAVPEALTLSRPWPRAPAACRLFLGAETLLSSATVYLLVAVNLDAASPSRRSPAAPLLAVWLVAASLSVPAFALGGLSAEGVCRLPAAAALLSGAFRLAVPALLLVASALVVALARPARGLPLALALSSSYLAVSGQRAVLAVLRALLRPDAADVTGHPVASLCLSLAHYALAAARPVVSWALMAEPPAHGEPDHNQDH